VTRPTVLLFDVDGTLVSCGGAGRAAMKAALRELAPSDAALDFPFAGGTDRAIARRALAGSGLDDDDASIERFLARYLSHLPAQLETSAAYRILDGVAAILDALEGLERYAIGLGTGNVERGARLKLARGGLDARFEFGGFGSDHEERPRLIAAGAARGAARLGRSVDACRVVVIGDTLRDVDAALAIGAECVGVGTGPCTAAELREAGATIAFDDLRAPEVLAALSPR